MTAPSAGELRRDFLRFLLLPALTLLVVPLGGWAFSVHGLAKFDAHFVTEVHRQIDAARDVEPERKALLKAFYDEEPPSKLCTSESPARDELRKSVCKSGGEVWQFGAARLTSQVAFALGAFALVSVLALGLLVSRVPRLQYRALVTGRLLLVAVSAAEVVLQGVLATWLSYWVTVLYMNLYVPKLILACAIVAALGMWTALRGIFRPVFFSPEVEGELVSREDSPALWARLDELAARVGTPGPAAVVAGIDDNFFVTEAKLKAGVRTLEGRSLFVSIPLLRVLSSSEADAVLAHELAHFRGGDTTESAKLSPALIAYESYLNELRSNPMTLPAFYVMRLFRVIFELARQKEQRERELLADAIAAEVTSADAVARALLKTTAYSSHRRATEDELFSRDAQHTGALALKERVASGLEAHVSTAEFLAGVRSFNVPHPFDSHPPLDVRLGRVGSKLEASDCEALMKQPPEKTWADEMEPAATRIEDRFWAEYERRFASAHEHSLAYRYLPETDGERALVERFFPPRTFHYKDGTELRLTFAHVDLPDGKRVAFRDIASAAIDDGIGETRLKLTHVAGSGSGPGPTAIGLRKLGDRQEEFKALFQAYWQRDTTAAGFAASRAAAPGAGG